MGTKSYSGKRYYILFVDDYSRMMTVMFLKNKSEIRIVLGQSREGDKKEFEMSKIRSRWRIHI